jgi:proton-dependent oligopeptide transporter, POT family
VFKRHPKGLSVLFFTEVWERFGFYTLSAIYVLYMEKEFHWDDSTKGNVYGMFLLLAYLFPVVGGWLGDKVLGPKQTVRIGAIMMAVGYMLLAASSVDRIPLYLVGLLLVAVGTGIFKVNMAVSVGGLYGTNDPLRDAGFNIYYMGVNIGAALAPLVATIISALFNSYNISFAAAGAGMIVALVTFEFGKKTLPDSRDTAANRTAMAAQSSANPGEDRQRVTTLFILFAIVIFFWIAFYQNGLALTLFADRSTVRLDWLRPETYQFFNPFFIILLTPLLISIFARMRSKGHEPTNPTKIFWGMAVAGFSMLVMVVAGLAGGDLDLPIMSPWWLIGSYLVITISEILVSPMGQSFVTKVAPARWQGLMMGFWFLGTSIGSFGSGQIGRFYSSFTHHQYFIILTVMLFVSALLVFLVRKRLNRFVSK